MKLKLSEEKSPKKKRTLLEQVAGIEKLIILFDSLEIEDKSKDQVISAAITIAYGNHAEIIYAGMNEDFAKLPAQYKVFSDTMKKLRKWVLRSLYGRNRRRFKRQSLGLNQIAPNIVDTTESSI